MTEIIPIPFKGISSNCYLIKENNNFILVDTSTRSNRKKLEKAIQSEGCKPGNLKLIFITHGDFDHCANAAYFKEKYNCPIAMHESDVPITESGNMFINKNNKNIIAILFIKLFLRFEKFIPDVFLKGGENLKQYGFNAEVIYLPGHTKGSCGLLLGDSLICGDFLENRKKPRKYYVDDENDIMSSFEKIKNISIKNVYPGHGEPFLMSDYKH